MHLFIAIWIYLREIILKRSMWEAPCTLRKHKMYLIYFSYEFRNGQIITNNHFKSFLWLLAFLCCIPQFKSFVVKRLRELNNSRIYQFSRLAIIPCYLYIYFACLFVCLSVCLYPKNVKTAEPFGPK